MKSDSLYHKTVVITGASSGAGRAMAEEFCLVGARLVLSARSAESLENVVQLCRDLGAEVHVVVADVGIAADVVNLAAKAKKIGGSIDVWVNNAGVMAMGPFDLMPFESSHRVIQTNLMGFIYGAQAAIPYFKEQGQGILINNISVGGYLPVPYGAAYAASKFGIRAFMAAIDTELSSWKNIHVCNLYPAFLDTPGMQHAANYTGRVLQPMPPVYDPQKLAKTAVLLARRPRKSSSTHLITYGLKTAYSLFPKLTLLATKAVIDTYLKQADPIAQTDGNLYVPLPYGKGVSGGWAQTFGAKAKSALTAPGVAFGIGLLGGFLLLIKKR